MTTTTTLAAWLLEQIAADEAVARAEGADAMVGARWKSYSREAYEQMQAETLAWCKRQVAVCEAHRRIVEQAEGLAYIAANGDNILRALAAIYADRDGFRSEWAL